MSVKHFCDICGTELAEAGRKKSLAEIDGIFDALFIDDVCGDCLNIAERINWTVKIKEVLREETA